jgi:DNA-directed RNA polymerase subunit RPC12/RpoP
MVASNQDESRCADCGVKITGVPVVPSTGEGPTQAQIEKLKPTVYLCAECATERDLSFEGVAIGRSRAETPPPAP